MNHPIRSIPIEKGRKYLKENQKEDYDYLISLLRKIIEKFNIEKYIIRALMRLRFLDIPVVEKIQVTVIEEFTDEFVMTMHRLRATIWYHEFTFSITYSTVDKLKEYIEES